jgi:hypothetical protein
MGLLYGRAGRLTAQNGGFRPGQVPPLVCPNDEDCSSCKETMFCSDRGTCRADGACECDLGSSGLFCARKGGIFFSSRVPVIVREGSTFAELSLIIMLIVLSCH